MPAQLPPTYEIAHRGGTTMVRLAGPVTAGDGLVDVVRAVTAAAGPIEVDLADAQLVDWSVIGFLARLALAVRPARVKVSGVGPQVHDMIIKARLDSHLIVAEVDLTQTHATIDLSDPVISSTPTRWTQHC